MAVNSNQPSKVLLDELFATEGDGFLGEFVKFHSPAFLQPFVKRWLADSRHWCREQVIRYSQLELNFPGHEVVFKTFFKHFESQSDHEMMAYFLVALDRIVRRKRLQTLGHNWRQGTTFILREFLLATPNKTVVDQTNRFGEYEVKGKAYKYRLSDLRNRPQNRLFTQQTRSYLRRRVWRYFRFLSYRDPNEYVRHISLAMQQYHDADFVEGENIIDNWSLMHAAYFHASGISFGPVHCNLTLGNALADLTPHPYRPTIWNTEAGITELINLVSSADSSLVRLWAMDLLERDHESEISRLDIHGLIDLMSHVDPRVQEFASRLFPRHSSLPSLPVSEWLKLLEGAPPNVLPTVCKALQEHVAPERLNVNQILELALARAVPVVDLGFQLLRDRHSCSELTLPQIACLATAPCNARAYQITEWALSIMSDRSKYSVDVACEFFDSLQVNVRLAAMKWAKDSASPAYNDPILWARLAETPFDDVRLSMIHCLETRRHLPGQSADARRFVWQSVILSVHRGGRAKRKAIHQLAEDIARNPADAQSLLPVLGVALRSLRKPERRVALSAAATLVAQDESWRSRILDHVGELAWQDAASQESV
jgi:hypothetical protein